MISTPSGASIDGRITAQAKAGTMGKIGSGMLRPKTRNGSENSTVSARH